MYWKQGTPEKDGKYIVTMSTGYVTCLNYTVVGGWNTNKFDGELYDRNKMEPDDVRGWMPYPEPMPNPATVKYEVIWEGGSNE